MSFSVFSASVFYHHHEQCSEILLLRLFAETFETWLFLFWDYGLIRIVFTSSSTKGVFIFKKQETVYNFSFKSVIKIFLFTLF